MGGSCEILDVFVYSVESCIVIGLSLFELHGAVVAEFIVGTDNSQICKCVCDTEIGAER